VLRVDRDHVGHLGESLGSREIVGLSLNPEIREGHGWRVRIGRQYANPVSHPSRLEDHHARQLASTDDAERRAGKFRTHSVVSSTAEVWADL
jgi:hypothetical protein